MASNAGARIALFCLLSGLPFASSSESTPIDLRRELSAVRGDVHVVVDLNRNFIARELLEKWRSHLPNIPALARKTDEAVVESLTVLRGDQLYNAAMATDFDGLAKAIAPFKPHALHKALGDPGQDLAYTPVTPCRIVDTRSGAGGTMPGGVTRNWLASNPSATFVSQGGAASDCGVPANPAAVLANITAADTTAGPAFLTAWPYGVTRPNASTLNWNVAGQQIANAVIIPLCLGTCSADFSVYVSSQTEVIIDVMGYFRKPVLSPVSFEDVASAPTQIESGGVAEIYTNNCPAGAYIFAGGCDSTSFFVHLSASVPVDGTRWYCAFENTSALTQSIFASGACSTPPAGFLP